MAIEDGRIRLWKRWATLPEVDGGGGVATSAEELPEVETAVLADAMYRWWWWLCTDIESGHPLLRDGAAETGERGKATALRGTTVEKHLRALRAWCRRHDLDDGQVLWLVTSAVSGDRPEPRPPKERIDLTVGQLVHTVALLDAGRVPLSVVDPVIIRLWHLRQRAALLTQVRGVNRVMEVGALEPARSEVVPRTPPHLLIQLPRTKTGARDVLLAPTGTELCALAAIADFWEYAFANGFGDELVVTGRWLPTVALAPDDGPVLRRAKYATERKFFLKVMRAAEVIDEDLDGDVAVFGTHALRRVLPIAADQAGWPLARIARLGGGAWAPDSLTAGQYVIGDAAGVVTAVLADITEQAS